MLSTIGGGEGYQPSVGVGEGIISQLWVMAWQLWEGRYQPYIGGEVNDLGGSTNFMLSAIHGRGISDIQGGRSSVMYGGWVGW